MPQVARITWLSEGGAVEGHSDLSYKVTDKEGARLAGWRHHGYDLIPTRRLVRVQHFTVTEFALNPDATRATVEVKPSPGMIVNNEVDRTVYVEGPNGERLPLPTLEGAGASNSKSFRTIAMWVLVIAAPAVVVFVLVVRSWQRRRRQFV